MKKVILYLSAVIILTAACNQPEKTSKNTSIITSDSNIKTIENNTSISTAYCYASYTGKDSVTMQLKIGEKSVTGNLIYKIFEKDANTGTFDAVMIGDTLIGDYKFMSEGIESVRQIAYIIKDGRAEEGYGPMKEEKGKMVFTDRNLLTFNKGISMKKIECIK